MRKILSILLMGMTLTAGLAANAGVLGDADDRYFGFQVTIPLEVKHDSLSTHRLEYGAMIVDQRDGLKEGIVFTRDISGNNIFGYLRPSADFEVGRSRISDYTLPLMDLSGDAAIHSSYGTGETILYFAVGVAVFIKLVDYASDEIVECIVEEEDCSEDE